MIVSSIIEPKPFVDFSSILDIAYLNLDFEIKIAEIRWKLKEIHYFQVEHSKFCNPNAIFVWSIFQIFARHLAFCWKKI